jgi:AraC family transcriptional regulator
MRSAAEKLLQNEYRTRVNQTIDYIQNNYSDELNLSKLAELSCFSKFHFHRIFLSMTGETPNDFVRRIRLDKAREKLKYQLDKSITEIALECGFSSSQNFAKMFKAHYGVPPSLVREVLHWDSWKEAMQNLREKDKRHLNQTEAYLYNLYRNKHKLPIDEILSKKQVLQVKIVEMPDLRVAYIRCIGPYNKEMHAPAFHRLLQWANPRGLTTEGTIGLGAIWSNDDIVPEDRLIFDACITIPESIKANRWVNVQTLPGGKYAIQHCEIEVNDIHSAWLSFFLNYLASSDYQPDVRPAYHIYYNNPETHPLKHLILDLCFPIKPVNE